MFGQKMKSAFYAAATASAMVVGLGVGTAAAAPVILNPSATNGGLGALSADGAFGTTQASLVFTSDLRINSAVNAPGSAIGVSEQGSFLFNTWGGAVPSNGLTTNYNIYGTFSFSGGTGSWNGFGKFTQDTFGIGSVTLSANPSCAFGAACAPIFSQATSTNIGVTSAQPLIDFILATAGVTGFTGSLPFASFAGFDGGLNIVGNGQGLGAVLALLPTPGTTGAGGFWQNVLPSGLNLDVTTANESNGAEITAFANQGGGFDGCPVATCSVLRTHAQFGVPSSNGTGSVTFDVVTVPEPATLVLFGAGLLGLGFMLRRRNEAASKA